ncbi:hypothetical protein BH10CYA1_BH10CYA1_38340 [soil metagenome]
MKIAVTLSILSLVAAALPALACDNKECAHSRGAKKSHVQYQKQVKEASKPAEEKKTEATAETKTEAK